MKFFAVVMLIIGLLLGCDIVYDEEPFLRNLSGLNLEIEVTPDSILTADGRDFANLTVYFPERSEPSLVKAKFTTSSGIFAQNGLSVFVDSSSSVNESTFQRELNVQLISSTEVGSHLVTIEIAHNNQRTNKIFSFVRAYPTTIDTKTSKTAVKNDFIDSIELIAQMTSSRGIPSQGSKVEYIVADSISSNESVLFKELTSSDSTGKSTVIFTPGTLNGFIGEVNYRAVTLGADGKELEAYGRFILINN